MRLAIVYKNFGACKGVSHIGLGVSAINISKSLRAEGIRSEVLPVLNWHEIKHKLKESYVQNDPITHLSICALWIKTHDLRHLIDSFPETKFAVNCHSNVGFLQAEPQAIGLIREAIHLEQCYHNFHVAGNSKKFCNWVKHAYGAPCLWLPNLYYLESKVPPVSHLWNGGTLKIGLFGALRVYKNFSTGVAAAVQIARHFKAETEIWINANRDDGAGFGVKNALVELTRCMPNVSLKFWPWSSWPEFKTLIGTMHLLIQPSYTESFNIVTADGVSLGVPSVVSHAIDWVPSDWNAHSDDSHAIARRGMFLIRDHNAVTEGFQALINYDAIGVSKWKGFLNVH